MLNVERFGSGRLIHGVESLPVSPPDDYVNMLSTLITQEVVHWPSQPQVALLDWLQAPAQPGKTQNDVNYLPPLN